MSDSFSSSDSPLHVVVVIEQYLPEAGGAERSTAQIVEELARRGHRVTVLCGRGQAGDGERVEVRCSPLGRPRGIAPLLGFVGWALRCLSEGDFDASLSMTTSVPAALVQPRAGLVVRAQRQSVARRATWWGAVGKRVLLSFSLRQHLLRWLERRTMRDGRVGRFVAISRFVWEDLRAFYGVGEDRLAYVFNAAEVPEVGSAQRADWRERIRASFGVPAGASLFLFPALDPWRKGLGPLLEAMKQLKRDGVPVVLAVAGTAAYEVQRAVAEAGLRDCVRLVGPTHQMAALYAAAEATVLPSFHDPASKVVIESLMLGTPVITTRFNGAADAVAPAEGSPRGIVLDDPHDASALTEAMGRLCDPTLRAAYSDATAGLAGRISMRQHVDELEKLLYEAARAREAARPAECEA